MQVDVGQHSVNESRNHNIESNLWMAYISHPLILPDLELSPTLTCARTKPLAWPSRPIPLFLPNLPNVQTVLGPSTDFLSTMQPLLSSSYSLSPLPVYHFSYPAMSVAGPSVTTGHKRDISQIKPRPHRLFATGPINRDPKTGVPLGYLVIQLDHVRRDYFYYI
ncbi:unnamed protein product [Protopolystoma xenopodis]|uniref:Uncharacterized protein n=1 Tax=Protopolystoma xenopodis TaxID=117903 RepID=A0A3S4ZB91_9PLAT|nr:unnamed protein product [Protopolystoma xenopodis]